jgi:hypothetical protein
MHHLRRIPILAVVATSACAAADDFSVDPKATFLYAAGAALPTPLIVELADVGLAPGDWAFLESLVDWDCGGP